MTNRQIDALVAEKVMGWVESTHKDSMGYLAPPDNPEGFYTDYDIPNYSTDISAAWEVMEKMKEIYEPDIMYLKLYNKWRADFGYDATILNETAPMAICLAALKAKGIEFCTKCGDVLTDDDTSSKCNGCLAEKCL